MRGGRVESLNDDILTLLPVLIIIVLFEHFGTQSKKIRMVLLAVNMVLIGYFSVSAFCLLYLLFYFGNRSNI